MKIVVPPLKSQGIKTKMVSWIANNSEEFEYNRWVEPFMGTGVVAFNIKPQKALLCDSNPHIIRFYKSLQSKEITGDLVREFLTTEGEKLKLSEGEYYYEVRNRFNSEGNPLDFLFLSRSCFNGMMRFNRKGGYNVPFCKKPNRFAKSLITKITNQIRNVSKIIESGDYEFKNQDFQKTLSEINHTDFIYSDPPYIGRHVDYFDSWTEKEEMILKEKLTTSTANFILSTWLCNKYRINEYISSIWKDCYISTKKHTYHVGAKEENRNTMYEALLSNIPLKNSIPSIEMFQKITDGNPPLI